MTLKVPYNFVPLNEKVIKPYWIDYISHDIPFKDGKSGTLKLTLTAESPIFVRKGASQPPENIQDGPQETYGFERDTDGNYFLPGSSTRGMIRSLVETLSFGRMIGRVSERRYALRDLSGSMKDEYLAHFKANLPEFEKIRGGWLRYDRILRKYFLRDADVPGRISHQELQNSSDVTISDYFSGQNFDQTRDEEKAAKRKYDLFSNQQQEHWVEKTMDFTPGVQDNGGRKICYYVPKNDEDTDQAPGRIVLTGQPGRREFRRGRWHGKHLEFIFWELSTPHEIEVPEQVVEDFKFAYFDDDKNKQSVDYEWRKSQLEAGEEIPVFWKQDLDSSGQPTVKHFGLSYLYKLPYDNTVEDSIRHSHGKTAENYDLADAIFGMAGSGKNTEEPDFLKGRVQFSHAKALGNVNALDTKTVILGEPRASFYPTYMAQDVNRDGRLNQQAYKTLMDDKAKIAGRKRYPILTTNEPRPTRPTEQEQDNLSTSFKPLPAGTQFKCELHYHNLRQVELGALLSAITLHGTQQSRHQIGMGKPLGFGKVKIEVDGLSTEEQQKLMLCYEAYLDMELGGEENSWRNSDQVKEVIALTVPVDKANVPALNSQYPYNTLTEFRAVKQNKEGLRRHSDEHSGLVEVGLEVSQGKQVCREKLEADKAYFVQLKPMTQEEASDLTEELKEEVKRKVKTVLDEKIEKLNKDLRNLQKEAEAKRKEQEAEAKRKEQEAEAKRKEQEAEAKRRALERRRQERAELARERGLDLSTIKPGRDPMKLVKKKLISYLENLHKKKEKAFNPEEYRLPTTDHDELINKIKELHASGKASKTDFGKRLSRTIADIQVFLGEEITKQLFKELN